MKYRKPYFDKEGYRPTPPLLMVEIGLSLFLRAFQNEIKDTQTWKRQLSLSQIIMERCMHFFWETKEIPEIMRRAKPFIALAEEAYAKNTGKTIKLFSDIMGSYSDIQHSAYARGSRQGKENDYVSRFNRLFDEYRFRYEELLNRLISFGYGCVVIIMEKQVKTAEEYVNIDANKKVERLQNSLLPSSQKYDTISASISGVKKGIRNALSHGGRRTEIPDEESFLLQDRSGWSEKYTLDRFKKELEVLNKTILSLEFATLVFHMNHIREVARVRKSIPKAFSESDKSMVLYAAAKDCQFEVVDAESKGSFLDIKLLFTPLHPRESEVFGNWGGIKFRRKIPADLLDLKGQVFRFVYLISMILDEQVKGVRIETYTYGKRLLVETEIANAKEFCEATEGLKGPDDEEGKEKIERKHVVWKRFSWADGEIKDKKANNQKS